MYGIGQGLQKGVETAGSFLIPAMRDKMVLDRREKLFDKELKSAAGVLAGNESGMARTVSGPAAAGTGAPGELLAGGPPASGAPAQPPAQQAQGATTPPAGAGPLAGVQEEDFSPMGEEEVFNMYKQAAEKRTMRQIEMADTLDVARGWQKTYSQMSNLKRSMSVIQGALTDTTGNKAMALVPQATEPEQARQILASEYMKYLQQYKPLEQEFKLWDTKRNQLGIKPEEINTEPGIAQFLNRIQQRQKSTAAPRPGAGRSVVPPIPQRNR